jgi:hypothetical protein
MFMSTVMVKMALRKPAGRLLMPFANAATVTDAIVEM